MCQRVPLQMQRSDLLSLLFQAPRKEHTVLQHYTRSNNLFYSSTSLPVRKLQVHKDLGGDSVGMADPSGPKGTHDTRPQESILWNPGVIVTPLWATQASAVTLPGAPSLLPEAEFMDVSKMLPAHWQLFSKELVMRQHHNPQMLVSRD